MHAFDAFIGDHVWLAADASCVVVFDRSSFNVQEDMGVAVVRQIPNDVRNDVRESPPCTSFSLAPCLSYTTRPSLPLQLLRWRT